MRMREREREGGYLGCVKESDREKREREGEIKFSKRDDCRNEIKKRRLILYLMRFRCFI
jgi:hypothetical protein